MFVFSFLLLKLTKTMEKLEKLELTMGRLVNLQSKYQINSKEWLFIERTIDATANEIFSIKFVGIKEQ